MFRIKHLPVLFVLVALSVAPALNGQEKASLTLEDCIMKALENNLRVAVEPGSVADLFSRSAGGHPGDTGQGSVYASVRLNARASENGKPVLLVAPGGGKPGIEIQRLFPRSGPADSHRRQCSVIHEQLQIRH